MGDQEFDICQAVSCMTKYCEMVILPERIRYCMEKALYLAQSGRPGPCWLDIPLDVQGAFIEPDKLAGFDPEDYEAGGADGPGIRLCLPCSRRIRQDREKSVRFFPGR